MSVLLLSQSTTLVSCAGVLYRMYEGEDGKFCIELDEPALLEVSVADESDEQTTSRGAWVNIHIVSEENQ